jgi:hypothetical protein
VVSAARVLEYENSLKVGNQTFSLSLSLSLFLSLSLPAPKSNKQYSGGCKRQSCRKMEIGAPEAVTDDMH